MFSLRGRWLLLVCSLASFSAAAASEPPRTDHYGDPLPKDARFRLGTVRLRHSNRVTAVGWMSNGRMLASAGEDWTVRLWQIPSGKQIAKWERARSLVTSPDGRILAYTGLSDDAVHCIDVASGKEIQKIPLAIGDCSAALSPDGKILVTTEGEGIRLYAVDTGKKLRFLDGKPTSDRAVPLLMFSPDGSDLIGMTDKGVCCWNIRTGARQHPRNNDWRDPLALSPDGKMLAAMNGGAITLRSWPTGEELRQIKSKECGFWAFAFSPNGKLLAINESGSIGLWDPSTGRKMHRCNEQWESRNLAFSPDGSLLASSGQDGAVKVWELRSGKEFRPLPVARHRLAFLGLASDGQALLTGSTDGVLTVWNARDGRHLRTLKNDEASTDDLLFGPNAGRMRALLRQEVESGRYEPPFSKATICDLVFSADSTSLAVTNGDDENRILVVHKTSHGIESHCLDDNESAEQARKRGIPFYVQMPSFSPDGRILAAAYSNDRLILWDWRRKLPIRKCSLVLRMPLTSHQAFSPDGRLLAITDGESIDLVEVASGKVSRQFHPERLSITSLTFAPDSRTLAVGVTYSNQTPGVNDSDIQLWNLLAEKPCHVLRGHKDVIRSLTFSPDGASLYSGGDDQTVLCWDVAAILQRSISSKELSASRLTDLWTDLASKDAESGQRAVVELIQAPDAALPLLKQNLRPIARVDTDPLAALIAELDHAEFARRDKASTEIKKIGTSAAPALRKALAEKPSLEMRRRIEAVLEAIDVQPLAGEELRTIRAVQVLETIGTPAARRILEGLAGGAAEALLTQEARAALQRLERRRTTP